jgi:hypothetical protein
VVALLLGGCLNFPASAPPSWGALPADAACDAIDGTFANAGTISPDNYNPPAVPLATDALFPRAVWQTAHTAETVTLMRAADVLTISASTMSVPVRTTVQCKGGWWALTALGGRNWTTSDGTFIGLDGRDLALRTGSDGALILRIDQHSAGIVVFAPNAGASTLLERFPRAS